MSLPIIITLALGKGLFKESVTKPEMEKVWAKETS